MSTTNENTTVPENPIFEPFPETNTMPAGWDLSGFTPDPVPALAETVTEATED
jgi:hypothetical protein